MGTITKEEMAEMLNGRQYGEEMSAQEQALAKASGLVVVFGASDDLMELNGAIVDEVDLYGGGVVHLNSEGPYDGECESPSCPHDAEIRDSCPAITALWDEEGYSWVYKTDIAHATFEILEGGEKYCRGIVFNYLELPI